MGSFVELNDTLQITNEQGFPAHILDVEKHQGGSPITIDDVADMVFEFKDKPNDRIYHGPPNRNYLAENRGGKWIYWGEILMLEQTRKWDEKTNKHSVSGKYRIIKIYDPEYQKQKTKNESPIGKSYF